MKEIAPHIKRQRLVIEGYFSIDVDEKKIICFYNRFLAEMKFTAYGKPIIHATGSKGKKINQGYDCFIPLIDSGIALYVWGNAKFFSVVIYTCKNFNTKNAVKYCKEFFQSSKITYGSF